MIEGFIDWVAGLPALAIYAVIGLLGCIENIFPPIPSDTGVALGAFLSHRGTINVWAVFGLTLFTNLAGAMGIYFLAARHSAALFESNIGKRLLPAEGVEFVRKEYARFGILGLFFARLLPGFRAIVPPFAGLIHLPPVRVAVVMALASSLWYGGIIYLAARLGEHWEDISHALGTVNKTLGILAVIALAGLGYWLWRRKRKRLEES